MTYELERVESLRLRVENVYTPVTSRDYRDTDVIGYDFRLEFQTASTTGALSRLLGFYCFIYFYNKIVERTVCTK